MASLPIPIIHIGYAKAASTWLQSNLLDNTGLGFKMILNTSTVRQQLVKPSPFEFEAESCRTYFSALLTQFDAADLIPVLSAEGLTGSSRIGDYQRKAIADRLLAVFPNARIFVVFREQTSMHLAQYHQYIRRGGTYSLNHFLHSPMNDRAKLPYFDWARFKYHHLITYYHSLFGRDKVLAMPMELLFDKPEIFLAKLCEFGNTVLPDDIGSALPVYEPKHPSQSSFTMNLRRPFNFLFGQRTSFNPRAVLPLRNTKQYFNLWSSYIDQRVPRVVKSWHNNRCEREIRQQLGNYYAQSNRELCELTGIQLAEFGYLVSSGPMGK